MLLAIVDILKFLSSTQVYIKSKIVPVIGSTDLKGVL